MRTWLRRLWVAALACSSASQAQYTGMSGFSFGNPVSASIDTMIWTRMNSRLIYRMMLKKRGYVDEQLNKMSTDEMERVLGGAAKAREVARQPPPTAPGTRFKASAKRLLLPRLADSLTENREYRKALSQVFELGMQAFEKEAAKQGLANDVAGAMTLLIGTAWVVTHDGVEPPEAGVTLLARQLQQALDTPELRQVADADKQKFYELLVGLATWLSVSFQQAVTDKDAKAVASLRASAADVLKGYLKLEPGTYRIGEKGLETVGASAGK
jgi:hypothetical protein